MNSNPLNSRKFRIVLIFVAIVAIFNVLIFTIHFYRSHGENKSPVNKFQTSKYPIRKKDVVIAVTSNQRFFEKAVQTISEVRKYGEYAGDIVFFYLDGSIEAEDLDELKQNHNVILKTFDEVDVPLGSTRSWKQGRVYYKSYFFKINVLDMFFKQWRRVMYIDAGTEVYNPIQRLLDYDVTGKLLAQSDAYPQMTRKLKFNYNISYNPAIWEEMKTRFGDCLNQDYFISCFFFFDTVFIREGLVDYCAQLHRDYPLGTNLDQPPLNLLFTCELEAYQQIPVNHDIIRPDGKKGNPLATYHVQKGKKAEDYVLVKSCQRNYANYYGCRIDEKEKEKKRKRDILERERIKNRLLRHLPKNFENKNPSQGTSNPIPPPVRN